MPVAMYTGIMTDAKMATITNVLGYFGLLSSRVTWFSTLSFRSFMFSKGPKPLSSRRSIDKQSNAVEKFPVEHRAVRNTGEKIVYSSQHGLHGQAA